MTDSVLWWRTTVLVAQALVVSIADDALESLEIKSPHQEGVHVLTPCKHVYSALGVFSVFPEDAINLL